MTGEDFHTVVDRRRTEVADRLLDALEAAGSALVRDPVMRGQLRDQVGRILDDTITILRMAAEGVDGDGLPAEPDAASVEIGVQRARQGIRPAESVKAASLLYETALRAIAPDFAGRPHAVASVVRLAVALERAISRRVGMVAAAYFTAVLDQVHGSHAEVARRLARELHDHVGHGLVMVHRDLELYETYRVADRGRAQAKYDSAKANLLDSIDTVRAVASQLRRSRTGEGLQAALVGYLASAAPAVATTVTVSGNEAVMPLAVRDELFLVLREALSNALRHADPRTITVEVRISRPQVDALVSDDGRGFEAGTVRSADIGTGLPSMAERTRRVGGRLEVDSQPGQGTTVRCHIPLPRRPV
jgi:signal transduction histidine kinase